MAISAGSVLLMTTGGVLAYAGFRGVNPLEALKAVTSGNPEPIRKKSSSDSSALGHISLADVDSGGGLPGLPQACERYAGDIYSMAKRWQPGYSDCSSFVGKGLKLLGVKPPGVSTTQTYLASGDWRRIPSGDVRPGDLACSLNHVVVCYGGGMAIGQQRPGRNVQRGSVSDLMYGNKPFVYLRYSPASANPPKSARA